MMRKQNSVTIGSYSSYHRCACNLDDSKGEPTTITVESKVRDCDILRDSKHKRLD